jgi:hypothetical protein
MDLGLVGGVGLALVALTASEFYSSVKEITELTTAEAADAEAVKSLGQMKGSVQMTMLGMQLANQQINTLKGSLAPIQNALRVVNNAYTLQANTVYENSLTGTVLTAGTDGSPTECLVSLDPGPPPAGQGILLAYGNPVAQPVMQLNYQGVTISAGAPNAGPQITLSPIPTKGVTLSYGPAGTGCSITLNAAGITLQVGPTTSLALKADQIVSESLQIEATGLSKYAVYAGELDEAVVGAASRLAASQMLAEG